MSLATNNPAPLTDALHDLVRRVQRSMVAVQNGPQSQGAGIIWRGDGIILTNNHVVRNPEPLVTFEDGTAYKTTLLDRDPEIDLALLKIEAGGLPAAQVADSRGLRIGELVLAVGHPWGQRGVVTAGVVSGLGTAETRGPRRTVPIIRSDVLLAPGNSGGPLVNAQGAVVGINTMIVGGDQGVAIPSQVASAFVEESLERRVVLGVGVRPVSLPAGAEIEAEVQQQAGLLVVELTPAGPANQAGVLAGDILVRLNGVSLEGPRALLRALVDRRPGELVSLGLLRGGRWRELQAELAPLERAM